MRFKGGLVNGVLASVYGAATMWILLYKEGAQMTGMNHDMGDGMSGHQTMQRIGYVMAVVGIILALYLLATKEVMGVPILLVGIVHIGMAAYSDHVGLQAGAAAMAVVAMVVGVAMLTRVRGPMQEE